MSCLLCSKVCNTMALKMTKQYTPYDRYTDSGVVWLGQVPEGWQPMRLKNIASTMGGFAFSSDNYTDEGPLLVRIGEVKNYIDTINSKHLPFEYLKVYQQFKVRKGNILIAMTGYVGDTSLYPLEEEGLLNQRVGLLRETNKCDHTFLYYLTKIHPFKIFLSLNSKSSAQENVSETDIGRFPVVLPPFPTQQKIAAYLDEKTATIDAVIEKKERLVELLEEKRKTVISEAVTKNFGKDGKNERLKFIASLRNSKIKQQEDEDQYIGMEHVSSWMGTLLDVNGGQQDAEGIVNQFKSGDVLFGKLRPYLAKAFVADFDGVCSGEFLVMTPEKQKMLPEYLLNVVLSEKFIDMVNNSTYGAKMPRASWDFIGNLEIQFPSTKEQKKIVESIYNMTKKIDSAIEKIKQSIRLLTEYKSSLIMHVMMGKICLK